MLIRPKIIWGGTSLISLGFLLLFAAGSGMTQALAIEEAASASLKLARELPADSLFYGYFCGTDKVKEDGKGTALEALINDPAVQSMLAPSQAAGTQQAGPQGFVAALEILGPIANSPTYAAVLPGPAALVVVEAGDKAEGVQRSLERLLADEASPMKPKAAYIGRRQVSYVEAGGFTIAWTVDSGRFIAGAAKAQAPAEGEMPSAAKLLEDYSAGKLKGTSVLADSAGFQKLAVRCGYGNAFALWYADMQGVISQLGGVLPPAAMKVIDASGIASVSAVGGGLRFDPPGMRHTIFAWTPGGRKGMLSRVGDGDVDEWALLKVPRNVLTVSAMTQDLAATYDEMMALTASLDEKAAAEMNGFARRGLGIDLRNDLLASLGNQGLIYMKGPEGSFMPEMVIRLSMKDQEKVKQAVEKLLLNLSAAASGGQGGNVSMETERVGDRDIYRIKFGGQMPIPFGFFLTFDRGDLVVAGFSDSALTNALKMGEDKEASLLAKADFLTPRKKLPAKASALTYEDTPAVFEMYFQGVMQMQMMAGMGGPGMGPGGPAMGPGRLPPLTAIQPHLFPAVGCLTADPEGITWEGYASVPGISAATPIMIQMPLLFASMGRAREQARAAACKNNLKMIGLATHIYASDHKDAFPSGRTAASAISELVAGNYLWTPDPERPLFICPSAEADLKAWNRMKKLTAASCSYGWISGLTVNSPADFILAYDKSPDFHKGFRNVLLVNGDVKHLSEDEFQEKMAEQKAKMGPTRGKVAGGE